MKLHMPKIGLKHTLQYTTTAGIRTTLRDIQDQHSMVALVATQLGIGIKTIPNGIKQNTPRIGKRIMMRCIIKNGTKTIPKIMMQYILRYGLRSVSYTHLTLPTICSV